jgi:hypothetical protein
MTDSSETKPYYQDIHDDAVRRGEPRYIDPRTGYLVFTELFHKERGTCCESACRHCPFGFGTSPL